MARWSMPLCWCAALCLACSAACNHAPANKGGANSSSNPKAGDANATSLLADAGPLRMVAKEKAAAEADTAAEGDGAAPGDAGGTNAVRTEGDAADVKPLTVGDPAPPVAITDVAIGPKVGDFKAGQIYVVEFWATWCPPCRASMPHLSGLQTKYGKKVNFIGVTDEDKETVDKFLEGEAPAGEEDADTKSKKKTWKELITYSLALDDNQTTSKTYMLASGQTGIPTAFIVGKKGQVEWIGHPMEMDEPLEQIVGGSWDREAFAKQFKAKQEAEQLMGELQAAVQQRKWKQALALVDKISEGDPGNPQWPVTKARVLLMAGQGKEANELLGEVAKSKGVAQEPRILNFIAWMMLTDVPEDQRDVKAAHAIIESANKQTKGKDSSVLDTLAKSYHLQGMLDKAIATQEEAIKADPGEAKEALEETLKAYVEEQKKDKK